VRWSHPINVPDFKFIQANTRLVPKITIPGPCALHFRGGDAAVLAGAYQDLDQFWDDTVEASAGSSTRSARPRTLCPDRRDGVRQVRRSEVQQWLKARGDDWGALIDKYIAVTNRVLVTRRPGCGSACICAAATAAAVALRRQLRRGRGPAVQCAQHSILLPGIRFATRRQLHAAALVPRHKTVVLGVVSTRRR